MLIVVSLRDVKDREHSDVKLAALGLLARFGCEIAVSRAGDSGMLMDALTEQQIPFSLTRSDIETHAAGSVTYDELLKPASAYLPTKGIAMRKPRPKQTKKMKTRGAKVRTAIRKQEHEQVAALRKGERGIMKTRGHGISGAPPVLAEPQPRNENAPPTAINAPNEKLAKVVLDDEGWA